MNRFSMQIGINLPPKQGHERSTSGVRKSKVKVGHMRLKLDLEACRADSSFSTLDGIQLRHGEPLKRGGGVACSINCHRPPTGMADMRLADSLTHLF